MLSAQTSGDKERFAFDPAHNRVPPASSAASTNVATANPPATLRLVNNWLDAWEDSQFRHDAHGNRVEQRRADGSVQRLVWDNQDQLTRIVEEKHNKILMEASYCYDALGRRIRKTVTHYDKKNQPSTEVTHFIWDGSRLLLERNASTQSLYVYAVNSFVPLARIDNELHHITPDKLPASSTAHAANEDDTNDAANIDPRAYKAVMNSRPESIMKSLQALPSAKRQINLQDYLTAGGIPSRPGRLQDKPRLDASKTYWYHCDHLGTPQELTDEQGNLVWAASYAAWGKVKKIQRLETRQVGNTLQQVLVEEAPIAQNLRFQGQYEDAETGLYYNRFRYYDAVVGRFVSQDPIGLSGSINLYKYASNPITFIDPLGLSSTVLDKAIGGRKGDCHQAHHLIPEEVMGDPKYKSMFDKLKNMGFDPDGAGNGIHLPSNEALARQTNLPGHWSNHNDYTAGIDNEIGRLYNEWKTGSVSDTQLALGIKDIQNKAKTNIETGKVRLSPKCRLL